MAEFTTTVSREVSTAVVAVCGEIDMALRAQPLQNSQRLIGVFPIEQERDQYLANERGIGRHAPRAVGIA